MSAIDADVLFAKIVQKSKIQTKPLSLWAEMESDALKTDRQSQRWAVSGSSAEYTVRYGYGYG